MEGWVSTELEQVDFNDKRLNKRFIKIVEQITAKPTASIPEACKCWADTKAAYRFFDSEKVKPEQILEEHIKSTVKRTESYKLILAVQDTSDLDFSGHKATTGIGYLENKLSRGLRMHSCLAVSPEGVPLGLLYQERWVRDPKNYGKSEFRFSTPITEKESLRWLTTVNKVESVMPEDIHTILIGDRESDIYDLFIYPRKKNIDILVRGDHDRRVIDAKGRKFKAVIKETAPCGRIILNLKKGNEHSARKAVLAVKFKEVEILPPKRYPKKKGYKPIILYAVEVNEVKPPICEDGLNWLLLTTIKVNTFKDAVKMVEWYTHRWLVERYHYTLKSGCKVEGLQLETKTRLERAAVIYCIVAWRLLWITYVSRVDPNLPCSVVLETDEWKALYYFTNKKAPLKPPPLKDVILLIAKLGGFLARKNDKNPGVKTIWRGFRRLEDIVIMWRMMGGK
jgi:hypothetical protein